MVQRQITWCVTLCHRFKSCWLFFGMLPHKSNACQPGCCVLSDLRAKMPGGYPDTPIFYCPAPSASSDRKEASGVPRFYRQKKAQWYGTYDCICTLSLYAEMRTSHVIQLQVVIKFLLLMYFLHDLCLASTNRTRDLWHEPNDTTYEVYRWKLVHVVRRHLSLDFIPEKIMFDTSRSQF